MCVADGVDNLARAEFTSSGLVVYSKCTGTYRNESVFTAMRDIINGLDHISRIDTAGRECLEGTVVKTV